MGCPLFGQNILAGRKDHGPYIFFANAAKKLGNRSIFRYYAFGMPFTSVSGKDNIKTSLKREFDPDGINTMSISSGTTLLFGDQSVLFETDKAKHALMRRLAGQSMSPAELRKAVPRIQATAENVIDTYLIDTCKHASFERTLYMPSAKKLSHPFLTSCHRGDFFSIRFLQSTMTNP